MGFVLIGGDAEIGVETHRELSRRGISAVATSRRSPDSGHFLDLKSPIDGWEPPPDTTAACIFAAIPRLEACANDPSATNFINVAQTVKLADRLTSKGIYVLFLSSSQVFSGKRPFSKVTDVVCPLSEYGYQKAQTEKGLEALQLAGRPIGILRLAKVVSQATRQLRDWPTALAAGKTVDAFNDMYIAPIPISDVASLIIELLTQERPGLCQLSGSQDISYAQIARYIAHWARAPLHLLNESAAPGHLPVGSTPRHTTLNSSSVESEFGIAPREPWAVIETFLRGQTTAS